MMNIYCVLLCADEERIRLLEAVSNAEQRVAYLESRNYALEKELREAREVESSGVADGLFWLQGKRTAATPATQIQSDALEPFNSACKELKVLASAMQGAESRISLDLKQQRDYQLKVQQLLFETIEILNTTTSGAAGVAEVAGVVGATGALGAPNDSSMVLIMEAIKEAMLKMHSEMRQLQSDAIDQQSVLLREMHTKDDLKAAEPHIVPQFLDRINDLCEEMKTWFDPRAEIRKLVLRSVDEDILRTLGQLSDQLKSVSDKSTWATASDAGVIHAKAEQLKRDIRRELLDEQTAVDDSLKQLVTQTFQALDKQRMEVEQSIGLLRGLMDETASFRVKMDELANSTQVAQKQKALDLCEQEGSATDLQSEGLGHNGLASPLLFKKMDTLILECRKALDASQVIPSEILRLEHKMVQMSTDIKTMRTTTPQLATSSEEFLLPFRDLSTNRIPTLTRYRQSLQFKNFSTHLGTRRNLSASSSA